MRKPRRWPAVLCVLLCSLGLLFLLSALVEAPDGAPHPAETYYPVADAMLLPAASASTETVPASGEAMNAFRPTALWAFLTLALPLPVRGRDANGRVLRKKRSARSFYPVFRQELACG